MLIPDDDEPLALARPLPVKESPTRVVASYCARPVAALEALELATMFPAADPTPAERGRYTLRRWLEELRGWAAMESLLPLADAPGLGPVYTTDPHSERVRLPPAEVAILNIERVRGRLRQAASLFAELGLNDLAEKCDGPGRFCTLQVEMLLTAGMTRLEEASLRETANPSKAKATAVADKPHFDDERNELTWQGRVIKKYKSPAPRQIDVLAAFEKEAWPYTVPSPFRDSRKLNQTIRDLNRGLEPATIRFGGDGSGDGVYWEPANNGH